ncbi:histone-like transcription factor [Heterostelium album PN500]|uniref:Histone-like transcription factor n=1 Tax=Heterostelium pallidum (strain ATCC 26659 / Pp 5 / PN500) TaxID=670386 RepID=D3BL01_HETP5|nr:histone-like transcription factor [Heterostelium album PN500]EFA78581.1 histone-like transcription factor [Heterostelium album PN500]|eukprot:XP_020430705.1 histone-like transcription factor [Heterostelium album PN500]
MSFAIKNSIFNQFENLFCRFNSINSQKRRQMKYFRLLVRPQNTHCSKRRLVKSYNSDITFALHLEKSNRFSGHLLKTPLPPTLSKFTAISNTGYPTTLLSSSTYQSKHPSTTTAIPSLPLLPPPLLPPPSSQTRQKHQAIAHSQSVEAYLTKPIKTICLTIRQIQTVQLQSANRSCLLSPQPLSYIYIYIPNMSNNNNNNNNSHHQKMNQQGYPNPLQHSQDSSMDYQQPTPQQAHYPMQQPASFSVDYIYQQQMLLQQQEQSQQHIHMHPQPQQQYQQPGHTQQQQHHHQFHKSDSTSELDVAMSNVEMDSEDENEEYQTNENLNQSTTQISHPPPPTTTPSPPPHIQHTPTPHVPHQIVEYPVTGYHQYPHHSYIHHGISYAQYPNVSNRQATTPSSTSTNTTPPTTPTGQTYQYSYYQPHANMKAYGGYHHIHHPHPQQATELHPSFHPSSLQVPQHHIQQPTSPDRSPRILKQSPRHHPTQDIYRQSLSKSTIEFPSYYYSSEHPQHPSYYSPPLTPHHHQQPSYYNQYIQTPPPMSLYYTPPSTPHSSTTTTTNNNPSEDNSTNNSTCSSTSSSSSSIAPPPSTSSTSTNNNPTTSTTTTTTTNNNSTKKSGTNIPPLHLKKALGHTNKLPHSPTHHHQLSPTHMHLNSSNSPPLTPPLTPTSNVPLTPTHPYILQQLQQRLQAEAESTPMSPHFYHSPQQSPVSTPPLTPPIIGFGSPMNSPRNPNSPRLDIMNIQMSHLQQHKRQYEAMMHSALVGLWEGIENELEEVEPVSKNHIIPLARIKKIMKMDSSVKMISADAPIIFVKACELFILELTTRSWVHTEIGKRRTLQKSDIVHAIARNDCFDFLIDIVPRDEIKPKKPEEPVKSTFMGSQEGLQYMQYLHLQMYLQENKKQSAIKIDSVAAKNSTSFLMYRGSKSKKLLGGGSNIGSGNKIGGHSKSSSSHNLRESLQVKDEDTGDESDDEEEYDDEE